VVVADLHIGAKARTVAEVGEGDGVVAADEGDESPVNNWNMMKTLLNWTIP
jgi:hypothetical protein